MDDNPFFEKPKKKKLNPFIGILQTFVIITSLGIVLYLFILSPNEVDGPSMEPNFFTHQLYFANKLVEWFDGTTIGKITGLQYQRGDVVVLQIPGHAPYIKRIIGLAGEKVSLKSGYTYINGQKMIEEYLPPTRYTNSGDYVIDGAEPIEIPQNNFIVFGDNRPVSNDSRYQGVGLIKKEWIIGKVILRFWPLNYFGIISSGTFKFVDENYNAPILTPLTNDAAVCGGDCLLNDKGSCPALTSAKTDASCPNPPATRCCTSTN